VSRALPRPVVRGAAPAVRDGVEVVGTSSSYDHSTTWVLTLRR